MRTLHALSTPWTPWALPSGGTSSHLATLGLDWGSRCGVWRIAFCVPGIARLEYRLWGGECRTGDHFTRARPDLPLPPRPHTPKYLETLILPASHIFMDKNAIMGFYVLCFLILGFRFFHFPGVSWEQHEKYFCHSQQTAFRSKDCASWRYI